MLSESMKVSEDVGGSILQAVHPVFDARPTIAVKWTAQGNPGTPTFCLEDFRCSWNTFRRRWCLDSSIGRSFSSFGLAGLTTFLLQLGLGGILDKLQKEKKLTREGV